MTCKTYKLRRGMYNAMSLDKEVEKAKKVLESFSENLNILDAKYERILVITKKEDCEMEIYTSGGKFSISFTPLMKTKSGYEIYIVRVYSLNLEGSVEIRTKCDYQTEVHKITFSPEKEEEPDY